MPIVTKAEFARLAQVTPSAVSEAIAAGLVVPAGPGRRDGIDTDVDRNRSYLSYPDHQRHEGSWRRRLREARAERDARDEIEQIMQMEPGYDRVAALTNLYWEAGKFPDGWSYLAVRDVAAENGLPFPLVFYSPDMEEGDLGVGALDRGFEIIEDAKGPVHARDAQGIDHPLVLRMFGKVPWLEADPKPKPKSKSKKPAAQAAPKKGK